MIVQGRFHHGDLILIGATFVKDHPDNRTEIIPDTVNLATLQDAAAMQALRDSATNAVNTTIIANDRIVKLLFEILFDHESRLRTLAAQPAITRAQYRNGIIAIWSNL